MKAKTLTRETIRDIGTRDLNFPEFQVGDTIIVARRIKEGDKERIQEFEGDVIAMRKHGNSSSFTVRKIGANAVPVELVVPFYSPLTDSIKLVRRGETRRAKLYYLRKRVGRAARVQEKVLTHEQKERAEAKVTAA